MSRGNRRGFAVKFGTYSTSLTTYAAITGWLDIGQDYESVLFTVKGGTKGAAITIETSEDGATADLQTITLSPPANGTDSYEVNGGLRRYYRISGNSADGGFAATTVDVQVKGVRW